MAESGYDTASYIYDVRVAADATYGSPDYWLRYFTPSPNGTVDLGSAHANHECRDDWDSGAKHLSPITSPTQSRLGGTSAQGLADAQAFVNALQNVYVWVTPLLLPTNDTLRCWLDQESSTSMSANYWAGWSNYINGYTWPSHGQPLYACLYCNPCHGAGHNCTTIAGTNCFAIWSSTPEICGYSMNNLPAFNPNKCSACIANPPASLLWQFAEKGVCSLSVNIDMNEGTLTPYSFYLNARP